MFLLLEARTRKQNEKNYRESQMCLKEHKEEKKTKRSKKTTRNKGIKCSSSTYIFLLPLKNGTLWNDERRSQVTKQTVFVSYHLVMSLVKNGLAPNGFSFIKIGLEWWTWKGRFRGFKLFFSMFFAGIFKWWDLEKMIPVDFLLEIQKCKAESCKKCGKACFFLSLSKLFYFSVEKSLLLAA